MLRILVVDDCLDAAGSLALLATLWGFESRIALGGEQALQETASFSPDAILLDIAMPRLDGFEVAHRLRDVLELRKILLVATTGCDGGGERQRAADLGFAHFLVKPIDLDRLKCILEDHAQALEEVHVFRDPCPGGRQPVCVNR